MTTESNDEGGGMDPRDDEALWTLLGRQEPPAKASPYFARRVLREVAVAEERGDGWSLRGFWALSSRHAAAWSGAFALGVLCVSAVLTMPASRPSAGRPGLAATAATAGPAMPLNVAPTAVPEGDASDEAAPVQDEELIADLDNLLSREESRLWTEDTDTDTARF